MGTMLLDDGIPLERCLEELCISEPERVRKIHQAYIAAGARVIEETIHEKLPEGFQRAEYLLEHGMVDQVVPRAELRATLGRILGLLREPQPAAGAAPAVAADGEAGGAE